MPGRASDRRRVRAPLGLATALAVVALGAGPQPASGRGITLGFGDRAFRGDAREQAFDLSLEANAEIVRLGVSWAAVAPRRPADPDNPADPSYRFADVDTAVRAASARGLEILLEVGGAPAWAEGPNRPLPSEAQPGTWRPDPQAYGQFARAIASRYGGAFSPALAQPALPRVSRYQAGNEPNLSTYLNPQTSGGRIESARIYRALLTSFYEGVKSVNGSNLVVTAGTGPYGGTTSSGSPRTHPLSFLREMLCLNGGDLGTAGCSEPVPFDVLAHHPINAGDPFQSAEHPEDATTPDVRRIRKLLRDAERKRRVRPAGSHPIWVTEFWWETVPPDSRYGVPERRQARYVAEAIYLFWKQRVPLALALQVVDTEISSAAPGDTFQTGVFFADGEAKDSLTAFRFPLVAVRGRRAIKVWGRSPEDGRLVIQVRRKHSWRAHKRVRVDEGDVFRSRLKGRRRAKVRAKVSGERSLAYRARRR